MFTYLALGDSYTIGEQVPFSKNFPSQTVALLRNHKLEFGDPVIVATTGWTTDELLSAIREKGLQETFSFVSLLIGVNNQYRGKSIEIYKQEFTELLQQSIHFAKGHSEQVFVLSIPDWGATPFAAGKDNTTISKEIDNYNFAAEKITLSHKSTFINITDSTRVNGHNEVFLAEDKLHPSGEEYAIWAERLSIQILRVLKGH